MEVEIEPIGLICWPFEDLPAVAQQPMEFLDARVIVGFQDFLKAQNVQEAEPRVLQSRFTVVLKVGICYRKISEIELPEGNLLLHLI